jgi:hypothetical protein
MLVPVNAHYEEQLFFLFPKLISTTVTVGVFHFIIVISRGRVIATPFFHYDRKTRIEIQ